MTGETPNGASTVVLPLASVTVGSGFCEPLFALKSKSGIELKVTPPSVKVGYVMSP